MIAPVTTVMIVAVPLVKGDLRRVSSGAIPLRGHVVNAVVVLI